MDTRFMTTSSKSKHPVPIKFAEFLDGGRGRAQELADFFEVHKNRISRIKKGVVPMPSGWLKHISSFAKSRGCKLTVDDLLAS